MWSIVYRTLGVSPCSCRVDTVVKQMGTSRDYEHRLRALETEVGTVRPQGPPSVMRQSVCGGDALVVVMWCDMMWCDVMWCDVMWCDAGDVTACHSGDHVAALHQTDYSDVIVVTMSRWMGHSDVVMMMMMSWLSTDGVLLFCYELDRGHAGPEHHGQALQTPASVQRYCVLYIM